MVSIQVVAAGHELLPIMVLHVVLALVPPELELVPPELELVPPELLLVPAELLLVPAPLLLPLSLLEPLHATTAAQATTTLAMPYLIKFMSRPLLRPAQAGAPRKYHFGSTGTTVIAGRFQNAAPAFESARGPSSTSA